MSPWRHVDLVHDAEMRMRLSDTIPPVPAGAMGGALREGTEGVEVLPVGEDDDCVLGVGG